MSSKKVEILLKDLQFMTDYIPIVQNHPCLWDKNYEESRNQYSRKQAWIQIAERIGADKITPEECRAIWTKIRIGYTVHLRHTSRGKVSRFKLAKSLEFLGPCIDIQLKKPVRKQRKPPATQDEENEDDPTDPTDAGTEETQEDPDDPEALIDYAPEEDIIERDDDDSGQDSGEDVVVHVMYPEEVPAPAVPETEEECLIDYCPEEEETEEIVDTQNIADQTLVVFVLYPEDKVCQNDTDIISIS